MVRQGRRPLTGTPRIGARRTAALLLASLLAAGCTSLSLAPPQRAPAPTPSDPRTGEAPAPRTGSNASAASQSLLTQSRAQRASGDDVQAAASLERALRIDPNNAMLWLELGELHLEAGNTAQAESMARRALTLAGSDRSIESQAERLLRAAASR